MNTKEELKNKIRKEWEKYFGINRNEIDMLDFNDSIIGFVSHLENESIIK